MKVFLSGPMGAGKSTVARLVAARLGVDCVDLDERVAARAGRSVEAMVREQGEALFRELERREASDIAATEGDMVVALGGGTVTHRGTRRMLLERGVLVTLDAPAEVLAERVGQGEGRPLLDGGLPAERLAELLQARSDAYAECHLRVATEGRSAADVAAEVGSAVGDPPVVVPLGQRSYRVEIGPGVRARLGSRVAGASRVVLVTDHPVRQHWGGEARSALSGDRESAVEVVLEPGETHKDLASVERVWDAALGAGVDRQAMVVALGGGVVGDVAGFAAATLLRGVAFGQVPTTLLAMVDSSVGGKTGCNRPQGKNLIGAFHQPRFVLCDVDMLSTLPAGERMAALAEVVKAGWLDGEAAVTLLERDADALREGDPRATTRAIRMAVGLKARIVGDDEREAGLRHLLNLGHTVGHALEARSGYGRWRHGEAVALGMMAAFAVAVDLGHATEAHAARARELLERLGLPVDLRPVLDDRVFAFVGSDKKRQGGRVQFVVPGAPGRTLTTPLSPEEVRRILGRRSV